MIKTLFENGVIGEVTGFKVRVDEGDLVRAKRKPANSGSVRTRIDSLPEQNQVSSNTFCLRSHRRLIVGKLYTS